MFERRKTSEINAGRLVIGGNSPITIQSMCNTDTCDCEATLMQVRALEAAGCDIVRLAVPTLKSTETIRFLKESGVSVPLVADIHFDYKIALAAIDAGADKIRLNPGNIGGREKILLVAEKCKERRVPIRIGVNGGSLEKHILEKYGAPTAEALAESALYHASLLEEVDFHDIVLSVKSSSVPVMIAANRILSERTSYPLHLGVTEAGGLSSGSVKGAVGIGTLLSEGIGDTVRVSLTADPLQEVRIAKAILSSLGLLKTPEMEIVSCPTCGRTRIDLTEMLSAFESAVDREGLRKKPVKVAIMGCAVNGPGEARDADVGIAGGDGEALLFRKGEILRKIPASEVVSTLIAEIKRL